MQIFNPLQKQYIVSIFAKLSDSKYMDYVYRFNNRFITHFIYNKLFDINNEESEVKNKLETLREQGIDHILNKDNVINLFFDSYPKTFGGEYSCNLIEIINNSFSFAKHRDKAFVYLSIKEVFNKLFDNKFTLGNF